MLRNLRNEAAEICANLAEGKPHMVRVKEAANATVERTTYEVWIKYHGKLAGRRVAVLIVWPNDTF